MHPADLSRTLDKQTGRVASQFTGPNKYFSRCQWFVYSERNVMLTPATNRWPTAVDGELQTASQLGSVPSTQQPSPQTLERRRRAVPVPSIVRRVKYQNTPL
jgi:hypothetical protein